MVTIARKRHAQRHKHPKPFNFVSGFIYTGAVIVSIALGALFYRGYRDAQKKHAVEHPGDGYVSPDLPPGARVFVRTGISKQPEKAAALTTQAPKQTPKPAVAQTPPSSPEEPAPEVAAPPVVRPPEPVRESQAMPDLKPLSQKPWTPTHLQTTDAQQMKLMTILDTSVMSAPAAAQNYNGGSALELPVRGNTAFMLTRYDVSKIKGWTVSKATWHAKVKRGSVKALSFSTILTDWDEGSGLLKEPSVGATFSWAIHKKRAWRDDGAPVTSVIRGNGYSQSALGIPDPLDNGADQWISANVEPAIVQALVAGASYGIAVCDEKGQLGSSLSFASREDTNDCPYLEVTGASTDIEAPGSIRNLEAFAHPGLRMKDRVGVVLTWKATGDDGDRGQAFKYDVRYAISGMYFNTATEVPRYAIPHPQLSGQPDRMIIENLDPNATYDFFIRAVDETGQEGPIAETTLKTEGLLQPPAVPAPQAFDSTPIDISGSGATLQIVDESVLADPVHGKIFSLPDQAPRAVTQGYFWDRATRTIHLRALRNETVGFLIVLGKKGNRAPMLKFSASPFQGAKGDMPGEGMRFFRTWYVPCKTARGGSGAIGDGLKPVTEYMTFPAKENPIPNQACQTVYAEIRVPASAEPGLHRGALNVMTSEGIRSSLNVLLIVLPAVLPEQPNFTMELVAPPTIAAMYRKDMLNRDDSMPVETRYDQLAREHRCSLAVLPYAQNGVYPAPFMPRVSGKALELKLDWSEWDRRFGVYLDGPASASHFILPLFESWPIPFENGYLCVNDEVMSESLRLPVYGGNPDEIHSCLNSDYWRSWRAAVQQIGAHFKDKGWTRTSAHVWLNNGPVSDYHGRCPPWSFRNPVFRDDLVALESYAQITKSDTEAQWAPATLTFRVNVPDGTALAGYGDELFDLLSVGDPNSFVWTDLRARAATYGTTLWLQNDTIPLGPAPVWVDATALSFFLEGADGWSIMETVGQPDNWMKGLPQCLLYPGVDAPVPSHRLKALRRAQQDIEMLILLQKKMGWTREQLGEFARKYLPGERGAYTPSADDLYALRYAVQELLK